MTSYYNWNTPPSISAFWNPYKLFEDDNLGFFYDLTDKSTLFQDAAGTVPVTADGQPVGKIVDKGPHGYDQVQTTAAWRPTYKIIDGNPLLYYPRTSTTGREHMATAGAAPVTLKPGKTYAPIQGLDNGVANRIISLAALTGGDHNQYTSKIMFANTPTGSWMRIGCSTNVSQAFPGTGNLPLSLVEHEFTTANNTILSISGETPLSATDADIANIGASTGRIGLGTVMNPNPTTSPRTFYGYMGAVLHLGRAPTSGEQIQIETWYRQNYPGISFD